MVNTPRAPWKLIFDDLRRNSYACLRWKRSEARIAWADSRKSSTSMSFSSVADHETPLHATHASLSPPRLHRYKDSIQKMTKIRSEVEEEKRELRERLRDAQQRERELFKELDATKEKGKGQLIQMGKLEEKLVQVSNANVELQASLLRAENTAEETDLAASAAKDEAIARLENENTRFSGLLTVERNERARLEEQTKAQAVQLKDMADKTWVSCCWLSIPPSPLTSPPPTPHPPSPPP